MEEGQLATCFLVCLAYSLILKLETVHYSEMSVNFYHITQWNIPEGSTFQVVQNGHVSSSAERLLNSDNFSESAVKGNVPFECWW
jgi:hypothetical protein